MRRRRRVSPLSMRRWPSHPGDQHHTLRPTDRGDQQFRSLVLVDGYQQLRVGHAWLAAVTAYPPPGHAPVVAPPPDRGDFICVQWALAAADGTNEPLVWICDVSYERYAEFALQLAGRVDSFVARRMRSVGLLLVLDVATSSDWARDDVRLAPPTPVNYSSQVSKVVRSDTFDRWLRKLKDRRAAARVLVRIDRLVGGNPGDVKPVGDGISELRINYGPGYASTTCGMATS